MRVTYCKPANIATGPMQQIQTACPNCQTLMRVSAEHIGKRVKCKVCGTTIHD